jgi:hypothetical protein
LRRFGNTPLHVGFNSLPRRPRATDVLRVYLLTSIFVRGIRFAAPEDLAVKLFELSQAMANDWPAIEAALKQ